MSANENDEVEIDLTRDFDAELVDLLEEERADLEARARQRDEAAEHEWSGPTTLPDTLAVPEPAASHEIEESDELPAGFADWTENRRQEWAVEPGLLRAEQRRRYALVDAITHANRPDRRATAVKASGWDDVDLTAIIDNIAAGTLVIPVPTVGMVSDGSAGLLYPGRVNGIAGDSGAGKSWIALVIAIEMMLRGFHVWYLDFEDSPELAMLRLIVILGADPALVRGHFHYKHPAHHDPEGIARFVEEVAENPESFVVIDSTGESISAAGLNQNHDEEVAAWFDQLPDPLAELGGATVLLLDHMVKSPDGGLWPIGSQRKRAAITGAQYIAEVVQPFSTKADGMVALKVAKDRHGAREAKSVATYIQFQHPVTSVTTSSDGTVVMVSSEELSIVFGTGKTVAQAQSDKAAKADAALAADMAAIDALRPTPKGYRDVKAVLGWRDDRAQAAMRAWRGGNKP